MFISALCDKSLLVGKPQATAVAFHASMFGQIALSFKQNFVDPYDKPGTRAKTYDRVLQFMIHTIFNQG